MRKVKTEEVIRVYNENNKDVEATATLFGITVGGVKYHLKRAKKLEILNSKLDSLSDDGDFVPTNGPGKRSKLLPAEVNVIIRSYTIKGMSNKEISLKHKRSTNTISAVLKSELGDNYSELRGKCYPTPIDFKNASGALESGSNISEPQDIDTLVFYGDHWYIAPKDIPIETTIDGIKASLVARGLGDVEIDTNIDGNIVVPCSFYRPVRYNASMLIEDSIDPEFARFEAKLKSNRDNLSTSLEDTLANINKLKCEIARVYLTQNREVHDIARAYNKTSEYVSNILVEKLGVNFADIRRNKNAANEAISNQCAATESAELRSDRILAEAEDALESIAANVPETQQYDNIFRVTYADGRNELMTAYNQGHVMQKLLEGIKIDFVASKDELAKLLGK